MKKILFLVCIISIILITPIIMVAGTTIDYYVSITSTIHIIDQSVESVITTTAHNDATEIKSARLIARTSDGALHVIFTNDTSGGNMNVTYAKSTNYGRDWTKTILTKHPGDTNSQYASAICADSNDNLHVVWFDTTYRIRYKMYNDTTSTWSASINLTESASDCYRAVCAINSSDDLFVAYMNDSMKEIGFIKKVNGVWNFTEVDISDMPGANGQRYPTMAIDNNDLIHMAWDDNKDFIYYRNMTSAGVLGTRTMISETNQPGAGGNQYNPVIAISSDGVVHVVWGGELDNAFGSENVRYTNNSAGWTQTVINITHELNGYANRNDFPGMSIDGSDNIHVFWTKHGGAPDWRIKYRNTTDYGLNWGTQQDLTTVATNCQYHPNPIWANHPNYYNIPYTGWALIFTNGSLVTYKSSTDLDWTTPEIWNVVDSGWFSFSNTSTHQTLDTGYFTFSNTSNHNLIDSGYFTFSNTTSWNTIDNGWFNFLNTSTNVIIDTGWFSFSNITNWITLDSGWFSFSNQSVNWNILDSGWFSFSNISAWTSYENGWFKFANTSNWVTIDVGWFSFGNFSGWNIKDSGWFNFSNSTDTTKPVITWINPTPADNEKIDNDFVFLNTTITDNYNTSAFFDWNNSLIGYWSMDYYNATGVFDNSSYDNFGEYKSWAASNNITYGKFGDGIAMQGNSSGSGGHGTYIDCGNDSSLQPTNEITIDCWINPLNLQEDALNSGVASSASDWDASATWSWQLRYGALPDLYLGFQLHTTLGTAFVNISQILNPDCWHHIVATFNGTESKIYLNGTLVNTHHFGTSTIVTNPNNHVFIGNEGWANYFNGTVDEFKIFNRALSQEEINASYNNGNNRLYHNFTDLSNKIYQYRAYAIDVYGNLIITATRNVSIVSWQTADSGWFSFKNSTSWNTLDTGWFSFSNITDWITLDSGWFSFYNSTNWNTLDTGWFSFGNTTAYTLIENGWFLFSNTSDWTTLNSGWFSFKNITDWNIKDSGWFSFSNISDWKQLDTGWFSFYNISTWIQQDTGWFTFNNISSWKQLENGWFNFKNISSFKTLDTGWFQLYNISTWKQIDSGWFWFENHSFSPISCFNCVVDGVNIRCTSCSTNTTHHKWGMSTDEVRYQYTDWIEDPNGNTHEFTQPEGGMTFISLTTKNSSFTDSTSRGYELITTGKDIYPPETYTTKGECQLVGYYWYNDSCHKDAEPLPWEDNGDLPEAGEHERFTISFGQWNIPYWLIVVAIIAVLLLGYGGFKSFRTSVKKITKKVIIYGGRKKR